MNMKKAFFSALVAVLFAGPAFAQTQEGSVAIAGSIRNEEDDATLGGYAKCVSDLKRTGTSDKEALVSCREAMKIMSSASKKIANEAADATKASRPVLVYSRYGYGYYGGGYYNSSMNSASQLFRMQQREQLALERARVRNAAEAERAKLRNQAAEERRKQREEEDKRRRELRREEEKK